jgi:hypothetical protein
MDGAAQTRFDRSLPRLRESEAGEELAAAHAEHVGDRAGLAVSEQHGVHALFRERTQPAPAVAAQQRAA